MLDRNVLQGLQRLKSRQALLGLSKHRLAMGDARFDQGCRLRRLRFDPAGAALKPGGEIPFAKSTRVVRTCENLKERRQCAHGLLTVHRHRACGIQAQTGRAATKKPPQAGGRVMGISTAYLTDPVIAGHLEKGRQKRAATFSTTLWIIDRIAARRCIHPARCGGSATQT